MNVDEATVGVDLNTDKDMLDVAATPSYVFQENGAGNGLTETLKGY